MARSRGGVQPEFYFPDANGDWADAFDAGITAEEAHAVAWASMGGPVNSREACNGRWKLGEAFSDPHDDHT